MRLPVSTSRRFERDPSTALQARLAGFAVISGAPDDATPGAAEETYGTGAMAACSLSARPRGEFLSAQREVVQ